MPSSDLPSPQRVGYVLKRYPRYSETFVVTEILAHEAAGLPVEIFSLYPCIDTHFQDCISRVKAPVRHIHAENLKATDFWAAMQEAAKVLPGVIEHVDAAAREGAKTVYQSLRLAVEAHRAGITHLHAHFATSAASVARLASKFTSIPYSFTAHAKDIFHEEVDPADLRKKLQDASAVVTVSDFNVRFLRENYGPAASRVRRIYNGLDLRNFEFAPPQERSRLVLGVGRLVEKKGFGDLIAACAVLARQGVEFQCKIVGDGECGHELRDQVRELGLHDHVELVGPMPQRDVINLMREAAVFAAPCVVGKDKNRDGLPTVLLEAMALGTPCVSTAVTGIPEIVSQERTGLLVAERDATALASAIRRVLDDPQLRLRLARDARGVIERDFDIHRNAAQIRRLFTSGAGAAAAAAAAAGAPGPVMAEVA